MASSQTNVRESEKSSFQGCDLKRQNYRLVGLKVCAHVVAKLLRLYIRFAQMATLAAVTEK